MKHPRDAKAFRKLHWQIGREKMENLSLAQEANLPEGELRSESKGMKYEKQKIPVLNIAN